MASSLESKITLRGLQKKVKIAYIISRIDKALSFEWIADHIDKDKFEIEFILLNTQPSDLAHYLLSRNFIVTEILFSNKWSLFRAFLLVLVRLIKNRPQIVHTHLFEANIIGLACAKLLAIRKRIYTRHHAIIHHTDHPNGLKWDKFSNAIATDIVSPSKNVEQILTDLDHVPPSKISVVHHGFDLTIFDQVPDNRVDLIRSKLRILESRGPIIGVIARYTHWKGIQYIIPAFEALLEQYPDAVLILANAHGEYAQEIQELLSKLPTDSYHEIKFEKDLAALYKVFDVFVHTPIDEQVEAFGQTYIEALAAGVPSVFTLSGVANEFIEHQENAIVVEYKNALMIRDAIIQILKNEDLRSKIKERGRYDVGQRFSLDQMIHLLEQLYLQPQ